MKGELWQECETCGTEPVCSACFKCAKHCTCEADAKAISKYVNDKQAKLKELLDETVELKPIPAGIKFMVIGDKIDFSPWGGGVYEYYTPIRYEKPDNLAGMSGVEYYEYIGGEDSTTTRRYWVTPNSSTKVEKRKADGHAWLIAKAEKDAKDKAIAEQHWKEYEAGQAKKAAKKAEIEAKENAIKENIRALDLSTMTKPQMLEALSCLVKKGIVRQSYSKAKIIEAVSKYLSGKAETARDSRRERLDQEYPDY